MKRKELIYLSGAITHDRNYYTKFLNAEKELKKRGYKVFNPARKNNKKWGWTDYMKYSIKKLVGCNKLIIVDDRVAFQSEGRDFEILTAKKLKIGVLYFNEITRL